MLLFTLITSVVHILAWNNNVVTNDSVFIVHKKMSDIGHGGWHMALSCVYLKKNVVYSSMGTCDILIKMSYFQKTFSWTLSVAMW